jgi:hypothetical protein
MSGHVQWHSIMCTVWSPGHRSGTSDSLGARLSSLLYTMGGSLQPKATPLLLQYTHPRPGAGGLSRHQWKQAPSLLGQRGKTFHGKLRLPHSWASVAVTAVQWHHGPTSAQLCCSTWELWRQKSPYFSISRDWRVDLLWWLILIVTLMGLRDT